ncbi:MAG: hypothetical protein ACRDP8_10440, partial [Actinopolymorphaceae bacterium]
GVISRGRLVAETTVADLGRGGSLRIVANPAEVARDLVAALAGPDRVRLDGDALAVDIDASKAAWVNTELVQAGISVSEIRWSEPDLEQTFLELTGEPTHVG